MIFLFLIITLLYHAVVDLLHRDYKSIVSNYVPENKDDLPIKISVLIPVRNEAINLPLLIIDLENQNYPTDCFEVIFIDDCSTDETAEVVTNALLDNRIDIYLLEARHPEGTISFKKSAIKQGINQAKYEYLLFTDGDCRVGPNWIKSMASCLEAGNAFVSGPVMLEPGKSFFGVLQQVEFSTLIGSGAAFIKARIPALCNGANIAYPKSIFHEMGGFEGNENIASGDDEFLLHKVITKYPSQVAFCKMADAVVTTKALPDVAKFFSQRRRWAGKWKAYSNFNSKAIAVGVFLFHLLWPSILIYEVFTEPVKTLYLLIPVALLKVRTEFFFIYHIFSSLNVPFKWKHFRAFAVLQFIYSPYVVLFGIAGGWVKGNSWKGRRI